VALGISQTVALELLGLCNYLCWYCVGDRTGPRWPKPILHDLAELRSIYMLLADRGPVYTSLYARGTEPALHPQIQEILLLCTSVGTMRVLTNLSIPITEWVPEPARQNCTFSVTLHPEAEEDIDGFLERVQEAQVLGCTLQVAFDASRIEETDYKERLASIGVSLVPRKLRLGVSSKTPIQREPGLLCAAGYDRFFIRADTALWRCNRYTEAPIPAPLLGPAPCYRSDICAAWKDPG
jgi:hypothetical protein